MLENKRLEQCYIQEYELESKKRRGASVRLSGYTAKITNLAKTLKRAKGSQMTKEVLENYHRQINNLYYCAYKQKNKTAIEQLNTKVITELVRLDQTLLSEDQKKRISEEFLEYLQKELPREICRKTLFEIYNGYYQQALRNKILALVPSRPELEFPEALEMKRHFVLHVGPTNSGKTFQALERLKEARDGIYLGPLRLLALEVFEKMAECGVACTMLTGQEHIAMPFSRVTASTVEMADFFHLYDIAVIDEAQMTADPARGHCWTKAILGLQAPEIHVCMSPAAESVVTHLIDLCGDEYEIHRYERKTKLVCEDRPFSFPEDVKQGDALVAFSKKSVLDIAGRLEEHGILASVIYGSLPPEIRRRQMELFTSKKTTVVVATDAIGMGLNLPVKRIVFIQTEKFDGIEHRGLTVQEIKQIAGRAGRYGIYDTGYITAMSEEALEYVRERYDAPEERIDTVSLGFPQILLDMEEPLDVIIKAWHDQTAEPPFRKVAVDDLLCLYNYGKKHEKDIAGFEDKRILYKMVSCPIDVGDRQVMEQWLEYCMNYPAAGFLDHPRQPEPRDAGQPAPRGSEQPVSRGSEQPAPRGSEQPPSKDARQPAGLGRRMAPRAKNERKKKRGIQDYETYYKKLDLYYQFSNRFDKEVDEVWLEQERSKTEAAIMQYLSKGKKGYIARCMYCGKVLPVGYSFGKCQRCFERQHQK